MDCSLPGFSVHRVFQARILEWVAISFSSALKWKVKMKVKSLYRVGLLATPWTAAHQAPPSMARQEYWSGLPLPSPLSCFSSVQFFVTPWTVACQASLFIGFSRQEYWSGVPLPSPNLMLLCFYWLPNICKPTFFIFHGLQDP